MSEDVKLTYLGCHWYEGNDSYCYVYVDENNKGFFIYTKEADSDLETVYVMNGESVSYLCGVAIDSIDLQASLNVIDYGYFNN